MKNLNENKWALVTGASGGVGKEIAKILAKKGWNLVLVARSESKLVDLSKELVESNSINVKTFSIDLASENASVKVFDFCKEKIQRKIDETERYILIYDRQAPKLLMDKIKSQINELKSMQNSGKKLDDSDGRDEI